MRYKCAMGITSSDVTLTSSVTMEAGANLESESGAIPCSYGVFKLANARQLHPMGTRITIGCTVFHYG